MVLVISCFLTQGWLSGYVALCDNSQSWTLTNCPLFDMGVIPSMKKFT